MSRLFDYIKAYETRDRMHIPQPLKMVDFNQESYTIKYGGAATIYRFEARLGAQVAVSDETKEAVDWDVIMKSKVYRPLAEEVFGEFRQPLIEAELAAYQGRPEEVVKLIRGVLDSMFRV